MLENVQAFVDSDSQDGLFLDKAREILDAYVTDSRVGCDDDRLLLPDVVRVISAVASIVEQPADLKFVELWFGRPVSGFGDKTPMGLIREGRTNHLLTHIEMLASGTYA